ncbi:hypothetical protein JOF47_004012 [Paeniglutamicibacter kerguelensis]|uniref:Uncharacterized protein n=1 Tax=Paeniglutamicibacter kerguelensis TaxID=254788 RepID=A0ABS4XIQ5_9MICC|nr:hypothetical protein [Paeniglutamicibacter kerguelensis]MBP2388439.1 hypothetical protein [Paeniglutamicibacter kerguelensis]
MLRRRGEPGVTVVSLVVIHVWLFREKTMGCCFGTV